MTEYASHDVFKQMYVYLQAQEIEIAKIERMTEVPMYSLESTQAFLTHEQATILWRQLVEVSGDPYFGLHFGESIIAQCSNHPFFSMIGNCEDLQHAFKLIVKHHSAVHPNVFLRLETNELELAIYVTSTKHNSSDFTQQIHGFFAMLNSIVCHYYGSGVHPNTVELLDTKPTSAGIKKLEEVFGCPILFDCPRFRITYSLETLSQPLLQGNTHFLNTITGYLDEKARLLKSEPETKTKVIKSLSAKDLSQNRLITLVANELKCSVRTLQQRTQQGRLHL